MLSTYHVLVLRLYIKFCACIAGVGWYNNVCPSVTTQAAASTSSQFNTTVLTYYYKYCSSACICMHRRKWSTSWPHTLFPSYQSIHHYAAIKDMPHLPQLGAYSILGIRGIDTKTWSKGWGNWPYTSWPIVQLFLDLLQILNTRSNALPFPHPIRWGKEVCLPQGKGCWLIRLSNPPPFSLLSPTGEGGAWYWQPH